LIVNSSGIITVVALSLTKGGSNLTTVLSIAPEIFEWIFRNISETSENQKAFMLLEQWKRGEKTPTFNKVEEVSKTLHVPLGYFFLRQPPQEDYSFLQYRTVQSEKYATPSRELIDTVHDMVSIQDWMHEYVKRTEARILPIVGAGAHDTSVEALTKRIRSDLDIKLNWFESSRDADASFKYLRERGEAAGIIVMMNGIVGSNTRRSLNFEEFRAFTLIDEYAPLIFINATDTKNGQLFSLVHELAHIWIGQNSVFNGSEFSLNGQGYIETKCNAVAAEILVPMEVFVNIWRGTQIKSAKDAICQIARYFKCSTIVVARRALDQKYITKDEYNEITAVAIAKSCEVKTSSSGGNYYATMATRLDHRFLFALASSIMDGTTLHTDAYRLTKTNRTTFSRLLEAVRG